MIYVLFIGGGFFLLLYYLPIYFQVVNGVTASQSGIRNLPLILSVTLATIVSGGLISAKGHFVPFMIVGSVLGTVGCGLLYSLTTHSSSGQWIGYQIVAGIGIGLAFQVPIISTQAVVDPSDLASATAMVLFFQTIGGAFFVSAGEVAFTNILLKNLPMDAPSVDPQSVVAVGVTQIRATYSPDVVPGIVNAYMSGLKVAYAIAIASAGISLFVAFLSKWRNLKGKVQVGGAA